MEGSEWGVEAPDVKGKPFPQRFPLYIQGEGGRNYGGNQIWGETDIGSVRGETKGGGGNQIWGELNIGRATHQYVLTVVGGKHIEGGCVGEHGVERSMGAGGRKSSRNQCGTEPKFR